MTEVPPKKNEIESPTSLRIRQTRLSSGFGSSETVREAAMKRILNQRTGTTNRVNVSYFQPSHEREARPHTRLSVPNQNIFDEDDWIRTNCERGRWGRTRLEHSTEYYFEDGKDALAFKMKFG